MKPNPKRIGVLLRRAEHAVDKASRMAEDIYNDGVTEGPLRVLMMRTFVEGAVIAGRLKNSADRLETFKEEV